MKRLPLARALSWLLKPFGYVVQRSGAENVELSPRKEKEAVLRLLFQILVKRMQREKRGSKIFFIQIGAFDGVSNDPLHPYIRAHKWSGILVEPQAAPFQRLVKNYAGHDQLVFINGAVGECDGVMDLHYVREGENLPPWSQKIASLNKGNVLKHRDGLPEYGVRIGIDDIEKRMEKVQVETMTFRSLVDRFNVDELDLLQIDAEGYDSRILAQVDFSRFRPKIIRYEHMHLSTEEQESCLRLLRRHGYQILIGFTETLAYTPD